MNLFKLTVQKTEKSNLLLLLFENFKATVYPSSLIDHNSTGVQTTATPADSVAVKPSIDST